VQYLGETNTMPKTSLQVKEVFVLKEKAAYAEHVHGAGFESTYNGSHDTHTTRHTTRHTTHTTHDTHTQ
jgi:hypothetical protein